MFNSRVKMLLGTLVLALAGIMTAAGQITNGGAIKFEVSHPFEVNNKTFPAGKYSITAIDMPDGSNGLLKIQSLDGKESAIFSTMDKVYGQASKTTELVFEHTGDTYVLSEIRTAGDNQASEILPTKSEKREMTAAAVN